MVTYLTCSSTQQPDLLIPAIKFIVSMVVATTLSVSQRIENRHQGRTTKPPKTKEVRRVYTLLDFACDTV